MEDSKLTASEAISKSSSNLYIECIRRISGRNDAEALLPLLHDAVGVAPSEKIKGEIRRIDLTKFTQAFNAQLQAIADNVSNNREGLEQRIDGLKVLREKLEQKGFKVSDIKKDISLKHTKCIVSLIQKENSDELIQRFDDAMGISPDKLTRISVVNEAVNDIKPQNHSSGNSYPTIKNIWNYFNKTLDDPEPVEMHSHSLLFASKLIDLLCKEGCYPEAALCFEKCKDYMEPHSKIRFAERVLEDVEKQSKSEMLKRATSGFSKFAEAVCDKEQVLDKFKRTNAMFNLKERCNLLMAFPSFFSAKDASLVKSEIKQRLEGDILHDSPGEILKNDLYSDIPPKEIKRTVCSVAAKNPIPQQYRETIAIQWSEQIGAGQYSDDQRRAIIRPAIIGYNVERFDAERQFFSVTDDDIKDAVVDEMDKWSNPTPGGYKIGNTLDWILDASRKLPTGLRDSIKPQVENFLKGNTDLGARTEIKFREAFGLKISLGLRLNAMR